MQINPVTPDPFDLNYPVYSNINQIQNQVVHNLKETTNHMHLLTKSYNVTPDGIGEVSKSYYKIKKSNYQVEKTIEMNEENYGVVYAVYSEQDTIMFLSRYGG